MKSDVRVEKFHSIEEMSRAAARPVPQPDFERFLRHCERYWAIAPRTYPRGVFRFRTLADAERAKPGRPDTKP